MNIRSFPRWTLAILIAFAALIIAVTLLHNPLAQAQPLTSIINCSGSIQACIDSATDGDTIVIAAGDYTESLTLNKPVSLTGVNSATTIIHAMPSDRVLTVTGATITNSTIISGLTFTGGNVTGGYSNIGGGILINASAQPLFQNDMITNNIAMGGGGIYASNDSPLTLIDASIISNTAIDSGSTGGGGVAAYTVTLEGGLFENDVSYFIGGALKANELAMTNTEFISNVSLSTSSGGAIAAYHAKIIGGRFEHNRDLLSGGGAIFSANTLEISGTTFISNTANAGGAIYAHHLATIVNGYFAGNQAGQIGFFGGGALYGWGNIVLSNTKFIENSSATYGGAIDLEFDSNATIINTLFAFNEANLPGTDLYANSNGNVTLLYSTLANSKTASAIAITTGTLDITNTIIANHAIAISTTPQATVYEDYNLFYGNITNTLGSIVSGGHSLISDPKFIDPANDNYHLSFGSAAIDHGTDVGIHTDLDGNPRPIGAGFDIGAYEAPLMIRFVAKSGVDVSNVCLDNTNPCATVQHAVDVADDNNEIRISTGVYTDIQSRDSVTQVVYISKTVTLRGGYTTTDWINSNPISNPTTLDAQGQSRVMYVTGNIIPTFDGLRLTNGKITGGYSCPTYCGGGILITDTAQPLIQNVIISDNQAAFGSAIYALTGTLQLANAQIISNSNLAVRANSAVITDSEFLNNDAGIGAQNTLNVTGTSFISNLSGVTTNGPAAVVNSWFMNNGGGLDSYNAITLANTSFTSNSPGGGVVERGNAPVTIIGGRFERNHNSSYGGGLSANGSDVFMSGTIFISNTANGGAGGADIQSLTAINVIFQGNKDSCCYGGGAFAHGPATITSSEFISNSTTGGGGGLVASVATINNSRFISNTAFAGGAIQSLMSQVSDTEFRGNSAGPIGGVGGAMWGGGGKFTNTKFIYNSAVYGGAISDYSGHPSDLTIVNSLFGNNTAPGGGTAIQHTLQGNVRLLQTTIANNGSNPGSAIMFVSGTLGITDTIIANHAIAISTTPQATVYEDYNLFYGNITNTLGSITSGGHSLIGDPKFVDPAKDDYHLGPGSAAIDHGIDVGITTDLDGNPRIPPPDIGAYEALLGTRYVATTGNDPSNDCTNNINPCATIQHAIDVANPGEQVVIASGLYTQNSTLYKAVSLTGVDSATTIIHAMPSDRVLTVTGASITNSTIISGLTFTGGTDGIVISDTAQPLIQNAIIYNNSNNGINVPSALLTLINTRVISNYYGAYASSATISNDQFLSNAVGLFVQSALNMTGTTFNSNCRGATANGPATIANSWFVNNQPCGGLFSNNALTLTNDSFLSNTATYGGGVAAWGDAPVTIVGGKFESNQATTLGGAIDASFHNVAINGTAFISNTCNCAAGHGGGVTAASATIINASFENNRCVSCQGGGLNLDSFATTSYISNSTFTNNAASSGGGLYGDNVVLYNSVFTQNSALFGGGAEVAFAAITNGYFADNTASETGHPLDGGGALWAYGTLGVTNTKLLSNSSAAYGGAILIASGSSSINIALANSLFAHNTAELAGAAVAQLNPSQLHLQDVTIADSNLNSTSAIAIVTGTLGMTDTIIANHAIAISNMGGAVYEDYNLFFGNITNTLGSIASGGHSLIGDPKFIDPANDNYHLGSGSAAIDRGIDVGVYTDLDGNPRDSLPDIGAYEFFPAIPISGLMAINDSPSSLGSSTLFTATVISGTGVSYQWNFGDGQFGIGAITTHTYAMIGTFTAIITASNGSSGPITTTTLVTITDLPISGLGAINDSPTLIHHSTAFTATALSGSNILYQWNFGDGINSIVLPIGIITHTYATYGLYTVTLTATNSISTSIATTTVLIRPYRWYFPIIYKN